MTSPPAPASEFDAPEFLDALRAGENRAYRALIRRFHGSLVGVASGIIGSRAQAEEVVQDAWLAVFNNIGRFEGRSSLAAWLFTIVLNRARSRIRNFFSYNVTKSIINFDILSTSWCRLITV